MTPQMEDAVKSLNLLQKIVGRLKTANVRI